MRIWGLGEQEGMGNGQKLSNKKGKTVRALRRSQGDIVRGLILSSRTESPDSKRIFTLWFCNSVLHTSKTLLQRPISIHAAIHTESPTPAWEKRARICGVENSGWGEDLEKRVVFRVKSHKTWILINVIVKVLQWWWKRQPQICKKEKKTLCWQCFVSLCQLSSLFFWQYESLPQVWHYFLFLWLSTKHNKTKERTFVILPGLLL